MDLTGKNAVVVGASSGIGRAIAAELTRAGASVTWCARRTELLTAAVTEAGQGTAVTADISTEDGCRTLVAACGDGVDLVVIASGASGVSLLADTGAGTWERILGANVIGPSLVVAHLLSRLAPDAIVAMLSSESVGTPYPGLVPYAVSKAALEELVRGWRAEHPELRFARVTVGATDGTDFMRDFDPDLSGQLFPRWLAAGKIPTRVMSASDVGATIARTLAHGVLTPGVDVQDIVLRAPGGPMSPDAFDPAVLQS